MMRMLFFLSRGAFIRWGFCPPGLLSVGAFIRGAFFGGAFVRGTFVLHSYTYLNTKLAFEFIQILKPFKNEAIAVMIAKYISMR